MICLIFLIFSLRKIQSTSHVKKRIKKNNMIQLLVQKRERGKLVYFSP